MKSIYDEGYDKGFAEGCRMSEMSDAYWLRVYAGQAMQGILRENSSRYNQDAAIVAGHSVAFATALLAELKKSEAQDE